MTINTNSDSGFQIITKLDKARIAAGVISCALSRSRIAQMSNGKIARALKVSEYAVRKQRGLMNKLGLVGSIKGGSINDIPAVPLTTWEEFHTAVADAYEYLSNIRQGLIATPYASSLEAILSAATQFKASQSPSLISVAVIFPTE